MALQFQSYGDPFARQKMDQQQKQQQYENLMQSLQMAGNGFEAYKQGQRRDALAGVEQSQNARQQFLFDRQYKPNPIDSYMNQDQGPGMQQDPSMMPATGANPMYNAPTQTQESPIVAMHKKTLGNGVPAGMSRADYADSLSYQKTQADTARDNAYANQQYVIPQYDAQGNMTGSTPLPVGMKPTGIVRPQQQPSMFGGTKAPAGYRYTSDNSLEAIPGGPADDKKKADLLTRQNAEQEQQSKAQTVSTLIDEALGKVGYNTSGFGGKVMGKFAGTEATNLQGTLDALKANLGFDQLMAMKSSSKNGSSGLGALSENEMKLLTSLSGSLDQNLSPDQLRSNLTAIKQKYGSFQNALGYAGQQQPGQQQQKPATVTQNGHTYTLNPATGQYE